MLRSANWPGFSSHSLEFEYTLKRTRTHLAHHHTSDTISLIFTEFHVVFFFFPMISFRFFNTNKLRKDSEMREETKIID